LASVINSTIGQISRSLETANPLEQKQSQIMMLIKIIKECLWLCCFLMDLRCDDFCPAIIFILKINKKTVNRKCLQSKDFRRFQSKMSLGEGDEANETEVAEDPVTSSNAFFFVADEGDKSARVFVRRLGTVFTKHIILRLFQVGGALSRNGEPKML
jgi:hypothetical protein